MTARPDEALEPARPDEQDVAPTSVVVFHPLAIRPSDDDPDTYVVGRRTGGEFVELPTVGAEAIRQLDAGLCVAQVEDNLADGEDRPDVAGLVAGLAELGFVATVDGRPMPGRSGRPPAEHLRWLTARQAGWLFGRPAKVLYGILVGWTLWTVARQPGLLPTYRDFFWTESVGLAVLVTTAMFVASAVVHEVMHLAAARSLGVPARIGFGTRLHNLVLQTDVSAAWAVPRRFRYRIYLSGLFWDTTALCTALLLIAYAGLGDTVDGVLGAYVLVVLLSMTTQMQVYMRTDLYFVLQDVLRCGDLFHDGLAYARYLPARAAHRLGLRGEAPVDPARDLEPRERKAVRVYAPLLVVGSTAALAVFVLYGLPILVVTATRAGSAVAALPNDGSVLAAVDGALVLLVEGALQVAFFITFYRNRRAWLMRMAARFRLRRTVSRGDAPASRS